MAKVIQGLKNRKRVDNFLLMNRNGQINKAPSLSSEHEISFLQYIEGGDLVAFLAEGQLPNRQTLHLTSLVKNGSKSNFTVCECEDPIEQLYVKDSGQGGFIVTVVSGENVITFFNQNRSGKSSEAMVIPANSIKALSDFVNIINGRLTPGIISSSTVIPITVTKTVITSEKVSTAMITNTARTDAVKTTKLTTEAPTIIASTSTTSKPSTEQMSTVGSTTVEPTIATVASQGVTTSTNVSSETETSTVKPTAATVVPTSTISKSSTELTTQARSTTVITSKATTVSTSVPMVTSETEMNTETATVRVTTSTNAPTTLGKSTQTVFTIPSARTREFTILLPQSTSSPQPTQLAIAGGSNMIGIIAGSLFGVMGVAGIIGLIAYKYVKGHRRYNTTPLADLDYGRRRSSSSSNEEIFTARGTIDETIRQSGIVLNSVSVESSGRSRSSSSSSSSV